MATVEERKHLPALKQVLKLYSSITISKLASIAEMDEAEVRKQLDLLRATSSVLTWVSGDTLSGEPQPCGDIDFTIEHREGRNCCRTRGKGRSIKGDFLIKHIQKFNDIIRDLKDVPAIST
eukprot:jgi/Picre1/34501/NNA_001969.t1